MFDARRPSGRLFILLLTVFVTAMGSAQTLPTTMIVEARWSDSGWGQGNDRNLIGRFTTQTFTIPRLSRVQNCYLQQYDASNPPRYSRYTAALHLDYPL